MTKDELIEFLKRNLELDVDYSHDNYVEIQLKLDGYIIDTVSVATGLGE